MQKTSSPYILISGPMGVGKSTAASALGEQFHIPVYLESSANRNPYLKRFYADMKRWAFSSQVFFLSEALKQTQEITLENKGGVQDRSPWEHLGIFATSLLRSGNLDIHDMSVLQSLSETGLYSTRVPDLMVYLHTSKESLITRIQERGRSYEQNIDPGYIEEHIFAYNSWIQGFDICKVVDIDTSVLDLRTEKGLKYMETVVRSNIT